MLPFFNPQATDSQGLATSLVIKPIGGRLHRLFVLNSNAAARYIQIFDLASLPADATVPNVVFEVPATSSYTMDFGIYGRPFQNGIVVCNSTTLATKTLGSADSWFDALWS